MQEMGILGSNFAANQQLVEILILNCENLGRVPIDSLTLCGRLLRHYGRIIRQRSYKLQCRIIGSERPSTTSRELVNERLQLAQAEDMLQCSERLFLVNKRLSRVEKSFFERPVASHKLPSMIVQQWIYIRLEP